MLYFKSGGVPSVWNGEPISSIRYTRNIEVHWSDAQLAALGLFRPLPPDPVPAGKRVIGESVKLVNNKVTVVYALEDIPTVALTVDDIFAERSRRLGLGFNYDFGDARGVHHIGTSEADMIGWNDVTTLASALIALGDTVTVITIITDTGVAQVTALEWQQILLAAAAFRQPIWAASFALQAMDPIPADFRDEVYWTPPETP